MTSRQGCSITDALFAGIVVSSELSANGASWASRSMPSVSIRSRPCHRWGVTIARGT